MGISDEDFREAYKPLHIPAHYNDAVSEQDKVIFALAQLGEGTAQQVNNELTAHGPAINAAIILERLFDIGLIKGEVSGGFMRYNLSKITQANDGAVDPGLLAPGLD